VKPEIPVYDIKNFEEYKEQGILAARFGYYSRNHKHLHSAHKHSFYHLVYFTQGSGSQFIDFKNYPVVPGLIYFMIPGQVHSWNFASDPDGYIINFSREYFNSFLYNSSYLEGLSIFSGNTDLQVVQVPEEIGTQITSTFEEILREGTHKHAFDNDLVRTLLLQVFIKVERLVSSKTEVSAESYNQTLFRNFQQLIAKHYRQLRLPKDYAKLLYITPNHLNALCKDIIGLPAGELIRAHVVLEAKRLLINLQLSISEIADVLEFKDHSYFIRFFKKHEGVTPEKFRKQIIQEYGK
jgi:AraC-like DNA-binding protein